MRERRRVDPRYARAYNLGIGGDPTAPKQMTITCANGIRYEVIKATPFTHNGCQRISYTCKRPRGRRTYLVIGYENGTFSTAA